MRRVRMGLTVCLLLGAAAALLLLPETAAAAAGTAVELCLSTLLPSLFPYFVLTELWVLLGAAGTLGRRAGRWMGPLFHLPGAAAPALLLGAIGGYPVGAQAVGRLYDQGALTRTEAEQTLLFCNNAGPAFVLGVVGGGLFGSPGLGAALLAIHLGSALLLGMLLRPEGRPRNSQARSDAPPVPFQTALPLAVRHGAAGGPLLARALGFRGGGGPLRLRRTLRPDADPGHSLPVRSLGQDLPPGQAPPGPALRGLGLDPCAAAAAACRLLDRRSGGPSGGASLDGRSRRAGPGLDFPAPCKNTLWKSRRKSAIMGPKEVLPCCFGKR